MTPFTGITPIPQFPILSLPVELIENVYASLDSFETAINLACTSNFMHTIFVHQKPAIFLSILPCDPILNRDGHFSNFYDQAVILYRQLQTNAIEAEARDKAARAAAAAAAAGTAAAAAAPAAANGDHDDDGQEENDDATQDDGTPSATGAGAKKKLAEESPEIKLTPLSVLGLQAVTEIRKLALVVNKIASRLYSRLAPRLDLGFDEMDIITFSEFGEEIICGVLYDLWLCCVSQKKLEPKYYKGVILPAVHKTNRALNADVVIYLSSLQLDRFGYPRDLFRVLPASYHLGLHTAELEARNVLLTACRERSEFVRDIEMYLQQQRLEWEREDAFKKEVEAAAQSVEDPISEVGGSNEDVSLKLHIEKLEQRFDQNLEEQKAIRAELEQLKKMLEKLEVSA